MSRLHLRSGKDFQGVSGSRWGFGSLVLVTAALAHLAPSARADVAGPSIGVAAFNVNGVGGDITINEGSTIPVFVQFNQTGETNASGFAGTTTHRFRNTTLGYFHSGSANGASTSVSLGGGGTTMSGSVNRTWNQDGLFSIGFAQDILASTREVGSSFPIVGSLGTNNLDWQEFEAVTRFITVANVAPSITNAQLNGVNGNITVNEGTAVSAFMQSFDPGADNLTFQIENTNAGFVPLGTGPPNPNTTRSSSTASIGTYYQNGPPNPQVFTVTFRSIDDDTSTPLDRTITVNNVAPNLTATALNGVGSGSITINEGDSVTAAMSANDPGTDNITFTFEGTPLGTVSGGIGPATPSVVRSTATVSIGQFTNQGTFPITFRATDDATNTATARNVVVNNVLPTFVGALQNSVNGDITVNEGTLVNFVSIATDPGADFLTFGINGPGITPAGPANAGAGVGGNTPGSARSSNTLSQTYLQQGTFNNTFTVIDDTGTTSVGRVVVVNNVAPTINALFLNGTNGNITVNEGAVVSSFMFATDPGNDAITFDIDGQAAGVFGPAPNVTQISNTVTLQTSPFGGQVFQNGANPFVRNVTGSATDDVDTTTLTRTVTINNVLPSAVNLFLNPNGSGNTQSNITVNEGDSVTMSMSATDPGNDFITFDANSQTVGIGGNTPGSTRTAGPTAMNNVFQNGINPNVFNVTGTATDDVAGVNSNTVQVTVNNVLPSAQDLQFSQNSGAYGSGSITVNEGDTIDSRISATDPGNDFLTFGINGPLGNAGTGVGGNVPSSTRTSNVVGFGQVFQNGVNPNVIGVAGEVADDVGSVFDNETVTVQNVAPQSATLQFASGGPFTSTAITVNEGDTVSSRMTAADPGNDSLTFGINGPLGNAGTGVGGTTPGSTRTSNVVSLGQVFQNGVNPNVIGVNGDVRDDVVTVNTTGTVTVNNVAPQSAAMSFSQNSGGYNPGNITVNEGDTIDSRLSASDPGDDFLTFGINGPLGNAGTGVGGNTPGSTRTSNVVGFGQVFQNGVNPNVIAVNGQVADDVDTVNTANTVTVNNVAPQSVTLGLSSMVIFEGQSITAQMTATDPGNDVLTFDIDGNPAGNDGGNNVPGSTRTSNVVGLGPYYENNGGSQVYTINGQVEDDVDLVTTSKLLTVLNVAPTIITINPFPSINIDVADPVPFFAVATDPGIFDVLTYEWDWDNDGMFDDFTGTAGTIPGFYFPINTVNNRVTVRVTDGDGGQDTAFFYVNVNAVIPEPGSIIVWSVLSAIAGTVAWRKRRRTTPADAAPTDEDSLAAQA